MHRVRGWRGFCVTWNQTEEMNRQYIVYSKSRAGLPSVGGLVDARTGCRRPPASLGVTTWFTGAVAGCPLADLLKEGNRLAHRSRVAGFGPIPPHLGPADQGRYRCG